jgi:small-conductance mechanosensitive channel
MKWLLAVLLTLLVTSAAAQTPSVPSPPPQKLDDLARLLEDPDIRSWLASRKQDDLQAEATVSDVESWEAITRARVDDVVSAIPRIPSAVAAASARTRQDALSRGYAPVFIMMGGLVLLGIIAEAIFRRSWRRRRPEGGVEEFLPVVVFAALMAVIFFALHWPPLGRIVMLCYLSAFVAYRVLATLLSLTIRDPAIRSRAKLFMAILAFAIASAALGPALAVDPTVTRAISCLFSLVLLGVAVEAIWRTSPRAPAAKMALTLGAATIWILWCIGMKGLFWIGIYAFTLPSMLRAVGNAVAVRMAGAGSTDMRTVLFVRGSRALVVAAAVAWLALVWHVNPDTLASQNPAIMAISYGLLKSVIVLLIADLVWHLVRSSIDRRIAASSADAHAGVAQAARATRLHTLLPIFRNVLAITVVVVAALIVLSELGVQIGPLIAGAGIFGVAIGFGSQTLVKDVISGVFYMLDDAFRVGEYIQAKSYKGTVEGFSLRSVRLRHHRGPVFTVPFGELGAVENMSRDWVIDKFRVSVGYDTDLEKARKIAKKIGAELLEDPELGPMFIQPLKMKGVEEFGDYGIVLSFAMTTVPGMQTYIRRKAYAKIREAFQANGIEFAQPSVQVGGDDKGGGAAAAATVRAQQARATAAEG